MKRRIHHTYDHPDISSEPIPLPVLHHRQQPAACDGMLRLRGITILELTRHGAGKADMLN
eukprot:2986278-Pleurochrysis_carterae.AAC.4